MQSASPHPGGDRIIWHTIYQTNRRRPDCSAGRCRRFQTDMFHVGSGSDRGQHRPFRKTKEMLRKRQTQSAGFMLVIPPAKGTVRGTEAVRDLKSPRRQRSRPLPRPRNRSSTRSCRQPRRATVLTQLSLDPLAPRIHQGQRSFEHVKQCLRIPRVVTSGRVACKPVVLELDPPLGFGNAPANIGEIPSEIGHGGNSSQDQPPVKSAQGALVPHLKRGRSCIVPG